MSAPVSGSLSELLGIEKLKYIEDTKTDGGTADGFRDRVKKRFYEDQRKYEALTFEAVMEAATRKWQQPPRKRGPDLFSINGYPIPETLTRPSNMFVDGDDIVEDVEQAFEKVSHKFATISDLEEDATITLRKGAQTSAVGVKKMAAVDTAKKRARSNMSAFLKDLAD